MRVHLLRVLLVGILATWIGWGARAGQMAVPRLAEGPVLDGALEEEFWTQAARLEGFTQINGEPPSEETDALLARTERYLYLGVVAHDQHGADLSLGDYLYDEGVSKDDSVELFVSPGTGGERYYQFMINAAGRVADQRVEGDIRTRSWDSGLVAVTDRREQGWSAEVAIPLAAIPPVGGNGRPWRINVCRNLRSHGRTEYITWAPGVRGFHSPDKFVPVAGFEGFEAQPVFAPVLKRAYAEDYGFQGGGFDYGVQVLVANEGDVRGEMTVTVEDRPLDAEGAKARETLNLGPRESRMLSFRVPVATPGDRAAQVGLIVQRDEPRYVLRVARTDELRILNAYTGRNYYTTEDGALVYAELVETIPAEARDEYVMTARVVDQQGTGVHVARAESMRMGATAVAVPVGGLGLGEYEARVSVMDGAGRLLATETVPLRKLAPGPTHEIKIDHYNIALLVDGEPYFPVGFFGGGGEQDIRKLAEGGFNAYIQWSVNLTPGKERHNLDLADEHGIMIIERTYSFAPTGGYLRSVTDERWEPFFEEWFPEVLGAFRDHPGLLGWFSIDEPATPEQRAQCQRVFRMVRERDPYHPVYTSFSRQVAFPDWHEYNDMAGAHIYWQPTRPGQTVNTQAEKARDVVQTVRPERAPPFMNPNSQNFSKSGRMPTPEEQRCVAYLTWIHGSRGTLYFRWQPYLHPVMWETLCAVAHESQVLKPALLTREPRQTVAYNTDTSPDSSGLPIVQVSLREHPQGGQVLLSANSSPHPVSVRYQISTLGSSTKVQRMFGDREQYSVQDGAFEEALEGLAARAYRITNPATDAQQPYAVRVLVDGEAVHVAEQGAAAIQAANLVPNGGFEDEGGWKAVHSTESEAWRTAEELDELPIWEIVSDAVEGVTERVQQAHSGLRCLKFVRPHEFGRPRVVSDVFAVQPNTTYEVGFHYRTALSVEEPDHWGGPQLLVYDYGARDTLASIQTHGEAEPIEWTKRTGQFTTGEQGADRVVVFVNATRDPGVGWVDDIYVREKGAADRKEWTNLLFNSSFERAALPRWPDSWRGGALGNLPFSSAGQDFDHAWHGEASFRIPCRTSWDRHIYYRRPPRGWQPVDWNKSYTLSVYAKADRPGIELTMLVGCYYQTGEFEKTVELTQDWKRYVLPVEIPTGESFNVWSHVRIHLVPEAREEGTIWVDAVQFERGTEASEYELGPADMSEE